MNRSASGHAMAATLRIVCIALGSGARRILTRVWIVRTGHLMSFRDKSVEASYFLVLADRFFRAAEILARATADIVRFLPAFTGVTCPLLTFNAEIAAGALPLD